MSAHHNTSTDFNNAGSLNDTMREVRDRALQNEIDAGRHYEAEQKTNPGARKCDPLIHAHLEAMLG